MLPKFLQAALVAAAGPGDELAPDGAPDGADRGTPVPGLDEARQMDLAVGGQALIEGVMMRSPGYLAMAVRTPDQRIVIRKKVFRSVVRRLPFLNVPILRGGVHLVESMALGIDALMFSADQAASEERVAGGKRTFGETAMTWGTVALSFALSLGLFFYLPILLTDLMVGEDSGSIAWNAVDGVVRVAMFVAYLWLVSRLKDMARVFQYHGAEHMSIHAFENGKPLDADGARPFTTLHPRCGTSFLFFVMLISIVVFSFLGRPQTVADRLETAGLRAADRRSGLRGDQAVGQVLPPVVPQAVHLARPAAAEDHHQTPRRRPADGGHVRAARGAHARSRWIP